MRARAQHRNRDDRKQDGRDREEDVDDAHDERFRPSRAGSPPACRATTPTRSGQEHRRERDEQRYPRAIDDAARAGRARARRCRADNGTSRDDGARRLQRDRAGSAYSDRRARSAARRRRRATNSRNQMRPATSATSCSLSAARSQGRSPQPHVICARLQPDARIDDAVENIGQQG